MARSIASAGRLSFGRSSRSIRVRDGALETCLERNRTRAESIDEQGVHVVYREFSTPDADVRINTDEQSVSDAVEQLVAALEEWGWLECDGEWSPSSETSV